MAWTKKIKKTAGKVTTAAKKRYGIGKGRGGFKFTQVAKDLEMIKSRLNVEKKYFDYADSDETVGQVDVNSIGYAFMDLTPSVSQGVGESQRVGNSVRATGLVLNVAARGQVNNYGRRKLKFMLVRTKAGTSASAVLDDILNTNPLTGLRDFYSERNYSGLKGPHTIVSQRMMYINPSSTTSTGYACAKFPFKLSDVIRWDSNLDTFPQDFRYFLYVFADFGNRNLTTPSTLTGVLEQGAASGVALKMTGRCWYVDN